MAFDEEALENTVRDIASKEKELRLELSKITTLKVNLEGLCMTHHRVRIDERPGKQQTIHLKPRDKWGKEMTDKQRQTEYEKGLAEKTALGL